MNKPAAYSYFIAGVVFTFCLYLILQRSDSPLLSRILVVSGIVIVLIAWRWLESRLHKNNLRTWKDIRQIGRLSFVLTRYLLLRGIILAIMFLVPSYRTMDIQAILLLVILVVFVTSILGIQEWSDCETKYQADLLHDAAASLRISQN